MFFGDLIRLLSQSSGLTSSCAPCRKKVRLVGSSGVCRRLLANMVLEPVPSCESLIRCLSRCSALPLKLIVSMLQSCFQKRHRNRTDGSERPNRECMHFSVDFFRKADVLISYLSVCAPVHQDLVEMPERLYFLGELSLFDTSELHFIEI